jgi:hypothetical protein
MQYLAFFLQNDVNPAAAGAVVAMVGIILIAVLVGLTIIMIPFWFICKKAGFSPWLTLINIIPMGNLILIYVLAFSEWKVVPAPPPVWQQPPYQPQPPYPPQA